MLLNILEMETLEWIFQPEVWAAQAPGVSYNTKVLGRVVPKPRLLANFPKHEKDTSSTAGNKK